MPLLPETIVPILGAFAPLFTSPTWAHAQVLVIGAILCQGPRTVAAVLRVMGLAHERRFERYHRVLSRARWSTLQGARILLGLLVQCLPPGVPVRVAVDETIERRSGERIAAKGCYRDAVRSTEKMVVKCFGLKWVCLALIVPVPWAARPWALPFLTALAPSKAANERAGRRHKTTVDWTVQTVKVVSRWLGRPWTLIGDGAYACVHLAWACVRAQVTLIARLRFDARLFGFPQPVPGRRGPKPKKGARQKALGDRIEEALEKGEEVSVQWYGGLEKVLRVLSGVSLWHTPGQPPVPIRWVVVVDPQGKLRPEAFFSTDTKLSPVTLMEWFVLRWNIEVTFEEGRRHLGLETQRQWSERAIARTTPILLALFSLVTLMAQALLGTLKLAPQATAWYPKSAVTFSDVLAFVRRAIWAETYSDKSTIRGDHVLIHRDDWEIVMAQLASTA